MPPRRLSRPGSTVSLALVAVTLAFATISSPSATVKTALPTSVDVDDPARGMVFEGLRVGHPGGLCARAFEIDGGDGSPTCTHGPDRGPDGHDVRRPRSLAELASAARGATSLGGTVPCVGDGVSGNRVQAIYAYREGAADNYAEVVPYIRTWAGVVDQVFNESAAETGGTRHVRFVTDGRCELVVQKVALSAAAIDSIAVTERELAARGYNRRDRKYLVWADAYVLCGTGGFIPDERPSQDNWNNGTLDGGMVARIDRGCWGISGASVEAHELVHTLGGVQKGAPNISATTHCVDDADRMCYDDDGVEDGVVHTGGASLPLRRACAAEHEALLDCNHDDYFHTNAPAGSYLATHWNVANSSFLTSEGEAAAPAPSPATPVDDDAPVARAPAHSMMGALARNAVPLRVRWSAVDAGPIVRYRLWRSVSGRAFSELPLAAPTSTSAVVAVSPGRTYRFGVTAADAAGNVSALAAGPRFAARAYQETNRALEYRGRWRGRSAPSASGRRLKYAAAAHATVRFVFRGRSVAWVAPTGPTGGKAQVYLGGRYVRTVGQHSVRRSARKVVFARSWAAVRRRVLVIRHASPKGHRAVVVDAFVVLD
jgi:hypothetical protein